MKELTTDHIIPISKGGQSQFLNCVTACRSCNTRKGDQTPEEAGMTLRVKPRRPLLRDLMASHREKYAGMWEDLLQTASIAREQREARLYRKSGNANET